MKKTATLPFLFLALGALIIPSIVGEVLDTDGNYVVAGTEYYILPAVSGNGGGLRLGSAASCPPDVVQASHESDNGLPVIFSPVNFTEDGSTTGFIVVPVGTTVPLSRDSNIKFSAATICVQSTVWTVKVASTEQRFVTTDGVEGNPGRETLSNWFNIQQFDDAYKLVFCPIVCNYCRPYCGDLSIDIANEDGTTRLVLGREDPFKVVFKKVI